MKSTEEEGTIILEMSLKEIRMITKGLDNINLGVSSEEQAKEVLHLARELEKVVMKHG